MLFTTLTAPLLATLPLLFTFTSAHFTLSTPPTLGFDDDAEGQSPCGGASISFDSPASFHVDGEAIAVRTTHPEANWLFRATLDKTAAGNWTDLLPAVAETGLGDFCVSGGVVPGNWAGQQGVLQIVQGAADGNLYQCAAVNFTTGRADSVPDTCKNATGLQASFTSDAALSATAAMTGMPSMSPSASGSGGSGTSSAHSVLAPGLLGLSLLLGGFVIGLGAVIL